MKYYKMNVDDFSIHPIEDIQMAEMFGSFGFLSTEKELDLHEITEVEYNEGVKLVNKMRSNDKPVYEIMKEQQELIDSLMISMLGV